MLVHITNSHLATIKHHMHYPIFMACTGAASLNTGKLPGHFSYKWPGYEASVNYDYATVRNTAVVQFCGKKYAKFLGKCWHVTEQIYNFTQP